MRELSSQEKKVLAVCEQKLGKMLKQHCEDSFFGKCEIRHICEMVKLVHQIRSIKGCAPVPS
jgi:hypothetical protein